MVKFKLSSDKLYIRISEYDSDIQLKQFKLSLTKKIRNYFFRINKSARRNWDGGITFVDKHRRIPLGLWYKVLNICKEFNYEYEFSDLNEIIDLDFDEQEFIDWCNDFFKDSIKKPRDYQIDAAIKIFKWKRSVSQIATSAGKTMIIFIVFAYLKYKKRLNKMLVIVPKVQLVDQTADAFEEFSNDRELLKYKLQMIYGGQDKDIRNVDIVIGTYQSLAKLPTEFYQDIDVICGDEVHTAQTESVKNVIAKCANAHFRFGLSGTARVKSEDAEAYTITSLFGPLINDISADFLFRNNYATPVHAKIIYLDYLDEQKKQALKKLKNDPNIEGAKLYSYERDLLINSNKRFEFIIKFMTQLKGNTLILFQDIKRGYGKRIHERLQQELDNNYDVYYIDGSTQTQNRLYYTNMMDKNDKQRFLVASLGCFSTGIDIKNLYNIFLVESLKSDVTLKQSVGRGMRLMKNKDRINIIDFVDDYSIKGYHNYLYNHGKEREKIYIDEKYIIKKYNIKL